MQEIAAANNRVTIKTATENNTESHAAAGIADNRSRSVDAHSETLPCMNARCQQESARFRRQTSSCSMADRLRAALTAWMFRRSLVVFTADLYCVVDPVSVCTLAVTVLECQLWADQ